MSEEEKLIERAYDMMEAYFSNSEIELDQRLADLNADLYNYLYDNVYSEEEQHDD